MLPSAVSMPVATTTSSICDVATLDLPSSLTTTAGELDTSHDSVSSDSSFPVVSLTSSSAPRQVDLSADLNSQGSRSQETDGSGSTGVEVSKTPLISDSCSTSEDTSNNQLNGTAAEKDQVYTKRSVECVLLFCGCLDVARSCSVCT